MAKSATLLLLISALIVASLGQNLRPIVGILDVPDKSRTSTIAADYVKWIESAGARVVAINHNVTQKELEPLLNSLNGVVFTGGRLSLAGTTYYKTATAIVKAAQAFNDKGDHFPVWGICMGFQILSSVVGGLGVLETNAGVHDISLRLNFVPGARSSRLLKDISDKTFNDLATKDITVNLHKKGISPSTFRNNPQLAQTYRVLATNLDANGKEFVSLIEGVKYPLYGSQFHPERNAFEWLPFEKNDHTPEAIRASQYFANFFVDEARKSSHTFSSLQAERAALIYQFNPKYTGTTTEAGGNEQTYYLSSTRKVRG